ncbi:hypothetical protein [uncultured Clostridium sp.]|uniref:hypothetical protein n=1 Tax=uncultured Clostridium sp. TaxID=59620 RepID=UPI002633D97E|nr:hypothetical protein [uncultured Clostridium sp.]
MRKKNGWKKKGNTLIEVALGMTLYLLLFLIITKGTTEIVSEVGYISKEQLRKNTVESGVKNIKQYLNKVDNLYFEIKENKLIIYKTSKDKTVLKDEIYLDEKNKLCLKYYRVENGNSYTTTAVILPNIMDFEVIKKGKLVYFKLIFKEGEKLICI